MAEKKGIKKILCSQKVLYPEITKYYINMFTFSHAEKL